LWLSEQAGPFAVIFCILAAILVVLYLSARARRSAMSYRRAGMNEYTFVNYLATFGFDADIARTTYQYLQERQNVSYPIKANDHLDEDLGLHSEDLEESVRELLGMTNRQHQPGILHTPLVTVEDLVRYVQACPRMREIAA
jgi:hypothetical protein